MITMCTFDSVDALQRNSPISECTLYGIRLRILLPREHRVTGMIMESLGIREAEAARIPGPEIVVGFENGHNHGLTAVNEGEAAKESVVFHVPKMPGTYPCEVAYWKTKESAVFEVNSRVHLKQGVLSSMMFKLISPEYIGSTEIEIQNLKDFVVHRIIQMCLLDVGRSFVHASAVSKSGKATLLLGASRSGKTTLALTLISDGQFEILADDLPVITREGDCLPNLEPITVEPSIAALSSEVSSWLTNQSIISRLHWRFRPRFFGTERALRLVPLSHLRRYCEHSCAIENVILVEKSTKYPLALNKADPVDLAKVAARIITKEMGPAPDNITKGQKQGESIFDSSAIARRAEEVYVQCFKEKRCYVLTVPEGSDPSSVGHFLLDKLF